MIKFITNSQLLLGSEESTNGIKRVTWSEGLEIELREFFATNDSLGIDTETSGTDPHKDKVLLVTFGNEETQYIWDVTTLPLLPSPLTNYLQDETKLKILQNAKFDYKMFYTNFNIVLNNVYDTMLVHQVISNGYDAQQDGIYHNLAYLVNKFVDDTVHLDKTVRKSFLGRVNPVFTIKELLYAADDVKYLHKLKEALDILVDKYSLQEVVKLENEVLFSYADMEINGFYLNPQYWETNVIPYYKQAVKGCLNSLDDIIISLSENGYNSLKKYVCDSVAVDLWGNPIEHFNKKKSNQKIKAFRTTVNWNSPAQLKEICKTLKFDIKVVDTKQMKEKESTDAKVLSRYANEDFVRFYNDKLFEEAEKFVNSPILTERFCNQLLMYRMYEKANSTYGETLLKAINPVTGRVHTQFNQLKTDTGRVSSGGSDGKRGKKGMQQGGYKPNLQNIPSSKLFREGFQVSQPEHVLISSDYSNMELRIVAEHAKEPAMIKAFNEGKDIHSYMGTIAFGVEVSKKVNPEKRHNIKIVNFALIYGASPDKFDYLFGGIQEARDFLNKKYFKEFAKLRDYLDLQGKFAQRNGQARTMAPYNRVCWFPKVKWINEVLKNEDTESQERVRFAKSLLSGIKRNGMNMPVQGTCADIMKAATANIRNFVITNGLWDCVKMVNQVHDELNVEAVSQKIAEEFMPYKKEIMIKSAKEVLRTVKVEVDCGLSKVWTK